MTTRPQTLPSAIWPRGQMFWLAFLPDGGRGASINPPRACHTCGKVIHLGVVRTRELGGTRWDCPDHEPGEVREKEESNA